MVEFSDLFDNEEDVFQKKAKVCNSKRTDSRSYDTLATLLVTLGSRTHGLRHKLLLSNERSDWVSYGLWPANENKDVKLRRRSPDHCKKRNCPFIA